jgi:hypothetical protein
MRIRFFSMDSFVWSALAHFSCTKTDIKDSIAFAYIVIGRCHQIQNIQYHLSRVFHTVYHHPSIETSSLEILNFVLGIILRLKYVKTKSNHLYLPSKIYCLEE